MRVGVMMLVGCVLLAGCGKRDAATDDEMVGENRTAPAVLAPVSPPTAKPTDGWVGRWVGVEGLSLQVGAGTRPGLYQLHITTMDGEGDYSGVAKGDTISFGRGGITETIRQTDGAGTGLKWLAGKTDCLTIKPGEGFCRD